MRMVYKAIAAVCGIGYIKKGGGSVAAAAYCILFFFIPGFTTKVQLCLLPAVLAAGVWSGNRLEKEWGHDSYRVVIDEVAGMMITLLLVPVKIKYIAAGFILFRFFDILKPLGIRTMEKLPAGWGVMADDVLAGIYAGVVLQLALLIINRYQL